MTKPDKETMLCLIDCGRETAIKFLTRAVSTAKNQEMLNNQVFVCRRIAIHLIATELYNIVKNQSASVQDYLTGLTRDIETELKDLMQAEVLVVNVPFESEKKKDES